MRALLGRVALLVCAAAGLVLAAPGAALALDVHHILPAPGAVLSSAPDHVEIMFDEALEPGHVVVGISPDATDEPLALPALVVEENVAVQPLPALPDGPYTGGFRVLGADGRVYQGTFGFTVGAPGTAPAPAPEVVPTDRARWLVPTVAAGLVVPAAALTLRARRRSADRPKS